jgi:alanine racemase
VAAKLVYNKPTFVIHLYSLSQIADIVEGTLHGENVLVIQNISTDTRKIQLAQNSLFIAINTPKNNGHNYVPQAIRQHIAGLIVSEIPKEACNFILVKNTLSALQTLAANHRKRYEIPVIAITGSNGKTIVKEYINHLLQGVFSICRSPKSYNSQIGVPLSVWQLAGSHTLGIFEAGISKPNEMENLERIIQPTYGVFTHFGDAHAAHFESDEQKLNEKIKLFTNCKIVVCPANETQALKRLNELGIKTFTYGSSMSADIHIMRAMDQSFCLTYNGESTSIKLPQKDKATVENTFTALATAVAMGQKLEDLAAKIESLPVVDMRLQHVAGTNDCQLILDYYNTDYQSTVMALDFLKQQSTKEKSTVILSDIQQSNTQNSVLYAQLNALLLDHKVSQLIGIGTDISHNSGAFTLSASFYPDTATFLKQYPLYELKNQAILLKGARHFTFEQIADRLRIKTHQTSLEVNLTRLQHNLDAVKATVGAQTKIMAMVKALAYGSGGFQIAKRLEFNQIDYLGVAYTDEATELKASGIGLPIMVLNPDLNNLTPYLEHAIQPVIFSFESLSKIIGHAIKIHLEFDTGMHRLGFDVNDLPRLVPLLNDNPMIEVVSIFSHLAGSDSEELDYFTMGQLKEFATICKTIEQALGTSIIKHIANTAGIERFPEARFDMVRLGIGLYGISAVGREATLLPVSTFKSYISQIKTVPAGSGIGYGQHDKADKERQIAVVAVGYADGYNRLFSQGKGSFSINGKQAKVVGNVCMDMTMCDVTDIACKEGDEVIIFGDNPRVEDLATSIDTIPYEILTNVSERVNRVFFEE